MLEQDIGTHDLFVRVEHPLRLDELQESLKTLGRKGRNVAADEPKSRPVKDKKQYCPNLEGVSVAVAKHLVPVVDASGGKVEGRGQ